MTVLLRLLTAIGSILLLTSPGLTLLTGGRPHAATVAHPALWMVKDADTTIYLFGTIHVLKPDVQWFQGPVKRAFDRSGTLVLEVVTPDRAAVAATTARLAIDPDGPPLTQKLDPATREHYLALLNGLGLPPERLEPFQPWFAAVTLSILPVEKLGYRPDTGAEEVLKAAAASSNKPVEALEQMEQQLGYFAGLPEAVQIAFLKATINDAEKAETEIGRMVTEWAAGHPDALADDMNDSLKEMPEIADALLYQRNKRWATWVSERLARPGVVFMAVGAGHLAGRGSVLDELAAKGLRVRRLE